MARPARLKVLLAVAVFAAHLAVLDWFGEALDYSLRLETMAEPMFTRLLQPAAPPPVPIAPPPAPAARVPAEGALAARLPQVAAAEPKPAASAPPPVPVVVTPPATAIPVAAPEPAPPVAASTQAAPSASAPIADTWPADTRLSYRVSGHLRGPVQGKASVQWQRQGTDYQVRMDLDLGLLWSMSLTSQGAVTPQGLAPRAYEEDRRGRRRGARFGELAVALENERTAPRPPGVQDTASQFVELAHRFATGREQLAVGKSVQFWMARPSSVDLWTYDVVGEEILQTPRLGPVVVFHLKPRPGANPRGNLTPEMWFAPSMQYLPVRIRLSVSGEDNFVDLLVDRIEQ
jgi:hypothetical protein